MPIRIEHNLVIFDGICSVEEALPLLEHLREHRETEIDLKSCTHLHTALLQTLAAFSPQHIIPPDESTLACWVMPVIVRAGKEK
ncbi:hypothetical protein [Magnetospirillum molischianum]|uniref:Uncharacterized protein n=1 Tax=Magnetospirillum molischianum DSM 120 TaxID=1150626 RepID=H8FVG2_MAGML|nr:hypothetical protein [Magnetospirillum molischianum]CCG42350.1 conserved hypothetical protein [Magnetospirillum molischianum DSM 120]